MAAGNIAKDSWKFSQDVLENSLTKQRYPNAYKLISWIVKEEKYKGATPFDKEKGIYMESVHKEVSKGKGDWEHIVDFAIGIKDKNGTGKSKRIRLVEAKFESKDSDNIKAKDLRSKVSHTSSILLEEGIPIEPDAVILINDGPKSQQIRSKLSRRLVGHYDVLTVDGFHTKYFKK